jgi:DNA-binding transcriptional ArsR family regulator
MTTVVPDFHTMITIGELATRLGVNRRSISRWLAADRAEGHTIALIHVGTASMMSLADAEALATRHGRTLAN